MSELPPRPAPPVPWPNRVWEWVRWVGPGRVVATLAVIPLVGVAAWWLVRPPSATTESRLPYTSSSATTSVLAGSSMAPAATAVERDGVVVHVAGAVGAPGVYQLEAGSRVVDAVAAAGGLAADANADAINLAALLSDGQRVYVPAVGEPVPISVDSSGSTQPAGPVDVNRATIDELETLPGVGPATAAAIVAYRDAHGPFASVDALADVSGIGPAKLAAIRDLVTV
ncbi:MAG TPA: helix-hairpin-helix domain-containing protein [Ilumatobacteraceae bacterium]|nr:helix-hairpin-helix domain-containing protein [Ilumatobacteraceae bacterium]